MINLLMCTLWDAFKFLFQFKPQTAKNERSESEAIASRGRL